MLSAWFVAGGIVLSGAGLLGRGGEAVILIIGLAGAAGVYQRMNGGWLILPGVRWRRFKNPFPFVYLVCALAALLGGAIYAPANYDAFSYRIPRILHWLAEGRWHWIEAADARKNFSATGFEWLMLPPLAVFHSVRYAFLNNVVSFLLLPGLVYSVFVGLGIKRPLAAVWMWITPCTGCFVMQAGSIGNDFIAATYLLVALKFALRARRSGQFFDIAIAVLSAALMTGAKASNIPLLLPVVICLAPVFFARPQRLLHGVPVWIVAALVSFLPLAALNLRHTGDWAGSPESRFKLKYPMAGLVGNGLMIASSGLAPAIFPPADRLNHWFDQRVEHAPLNQIKSRFPELKLTLSPMASEETAGLGLGVSAALLMAFFGAGWNFRLRRIPHTGALVCAGFWVALLVYMAKLGNYSAPRLIAPYYSGLIATPLLLMRSSGVIRRRWWQIGSLLVLSPILPALAMNPVRPLLPMQRLLGQIEGLGYHNGTLSRMKTVYETYAVRSDAHQSVRALLPANAVHIGFAGTADESEYSFWLPLGTRRVRDLIRTADGGVPDVRGLDAIVASDWGCNDRFGITPSQLAERLGWQIEGSVKVQTYASQAAATWTVIRPPNPGGNP